MEVHVALFQDTKWLQENTRDPYQVLLTGAPTEDYAYFAVARGSVNSIISQSNHGDFMVKFGSGLYEVRLDDLLTFLNQRYAVINTAVINNTENGDRPETVYERCSECHRYVLESTRCAECRPAAKHAGKK